LTTISIFGVGSGAYALFDSLFTPSASVDNSNFGNVSAIYGNSCANQPHEFDISQAAPSTTQSHSKIPMISLMQVNIGNISDTGYLALVNRRHGISTELDGELLVSVWPTVPVRIIEGMYLHPTALQAISDMMDTARNYDVGTFFVSSGFRNRDRQSALYNNGANRAFALPPGHSEHHIGLAADIMIVGISQTEMSNSAGGRWLADNSYRYGLILRYPQGATHITGIEFEPWHFRYVGRPHAYYMQQHNLVLEEYIELIQHSGGFSFEMDGKTYHLSHQMPQGGMINVPTELEFIVSNDNMGGYIVTAWE
jgi:D-alanyl-D-alanine carboxypeptidase